MAASRKNTPTHVPSRRVGQAKKNKDEEELRIRRKTDGQQPERDEPGVLATWRPRVPVQVSQYFQSSKSHDFCPILLLVNIFAHRARSSERKK